MAVPRFWIENHIFNGATLDPSSESSSNPVEALEDQQRNYFWRTATGWTITEHNRYLDFDIGAGQLTATIATGTYTTGASLATAIVTALEAASAPPVWACDYNVTQPNKFTISQGSNFTIRWSTGTNAYRSIGRSLGFNVGANDTGATTFTADGVSYQSTHHLVVTLTAAQVASGVTAAAVIEHNVSLSTGNAFRLESSATNVWSSPTTQANFFGITEDDCRKYFSDPAHTYYRLVVDDVANTTGYFQLGVLFLAPYRASLFCMSDNRTDGYQDFSNLNLAMNGANFVTFREKRYTFAFEIAEIADGVNVDKFQGWRTFTFDRMNAGQNIIIDLDPTGAIPMPYTLLYGYCPELPVFPFVPGGYWNVSFPFVKAL